MEKKQINYTIVVIGKLEETQIHQTKVGRRWTWRSPSGNTANKIDYIMMVKPSVVTDMTAINRISIGIDYMMVIGSVTLNTREERMNPLNKKTQTIIDTHMIGLKKNSFQLELRNDPTKCDEHSKANHKKAYNFVVNSTLYKYNIFDSRQYQYR